VEVGGDAPQGASEKGAEQADAPAEKPIGGFRVEGAGYRVQGSGYRDQGSGFRVQGSGFRARGETDRFVCPHSRRSVPIVGLEGFEELYPKSQARIWT